MAASAATRDMAMTDQVAAEMAEGSAPRSRADAHGEVRALCGAKVTFSTTHTTYQVNPYPDHYAHHPSRVVATSDGFQQGKTHADRCTGKGVAVMDARKRKVWSRYGLENAKTRREMILRQLADNKRMWLDM